MAATAVASDQIQKEESGRFNPISGGHDRPAQYKMIDVDQGAAAGDDGSTLRLAIFPPGKITLLLAEARLAHSAFGTSRVMKIGHTAYTEPDGDAVAADDDDLDSNVDVSSAGSFAPTGTIGGAETKTFETKDGFEIFATVTGGTIPAAATVNGYIPFIKHQ